MINMIYNFAASLTFGYMERYYFKTVDLTWQVIMALLATQIPNLVLILYEG